MKLLDYVNSYGTSEGVKKGWDSRGRSTFAPSMDKRAGILQPHPMVHALNLWKTHPKWSPTFVAFHVAQKYNMKEEEALRHVKVAMKKLGKA